MYRKHRRLPARRSSLPPRVTRLAPAALALALVLSPSAAHAGGGGGGGLAWETPLQTIVASITGPVAMAVSLLGIVVSGATLIWGGEINEFVRRMVMLALVIAIIVAAASVLSALFGVGATL